MENIKEITDSLGQVHIVIDKGNNEFISMTKEAYDKQQAAQATLASESAKELTESVTNDSTGNK